MTPADKGRFCGACQKNVRDFTRSSDREIATAFAKDKDLCGRFRQTQLDRDLVIPAEKSTVWIAASAAVLSFIGLSTHESAAQEVPATEQHEAQMNYVGKPSASKFVTITGTVSENLGPFPGVSIFNKGSQLITQTDIDGKYTIEAAPGDVLEFSIIGYVTKEMVVGEATTIDIIMEDDEIVLLGGPMIFTRERTFFGRIFHSIGNWFR